jgi:hypothetical protein
MEFIKLFEEYNKGTRGQSIPMDKAVDMYFENCTDWDLELKEQTLYRGSNSNYIFYVNAGSETHEPRHSRNTNNFYTSLMANAPSWEKAPRRDKSLIMTNSGWIAETYGTKFIMIPFNGTKIGVCPTGDIWGSVVSHTISSTGYKHEFTMENFGYEVGNFLMSNIKDENIVKHRPDGSGFYTPNGVNSESIKEMIELVDKIPKDQINLYYISFMFQGKGKYKKIVSETKYTFIEDWENNHPQLGLLEYLYKALDFDKLGFTIIQKQTDMPPPEREYWSDGEFIGVCEEYYEEFQKKVSERKGTNPQ